MIGGALFVPVAAHCIDESRADPRAELQDGLQAGHLEIWMDIHELDVRHPTRAELIAPPMSNGIRPTASGRVPTGTARSVTASKPASAAAAIDSEGDAPATVR